MSGDKLGDGSEVDFFFLGSGDNNVGVWGVSSSFTSKFEDWVWCFFFVRSSVYRSPTASVLGSFFIKNTKSVSGGCGSFNYESVLFEMCAPPL